MWARDKNRPSAAKRGYGRTWAKIRAGQLSEFPWCFDCAGAANEVHHMDRDSANNAGENLMSLCHACHSARTMRESVAGVK